MSIGTPEGVLVDLDQTVPQVLKTLPHPVDWADAWCQAANGYPMVQTVAEACDPVGGILEIGSLYGYSGIALLRGARRATSYTQIDAELYYPNSRQIAAANIRAYLDQHEPGRTVELADLDDTCYIRFLSGIDLVHVDGGHGFETCLADLAQCVGYLHPRFVLIDDLAHPTLPEVRRAVDLFARLVRVGYVEVPSVHGLALFDFSESQEARHRLRSAGIAAEWRSWAWGAAA